MAESSDLWPHQQRARRLVRAAWDAGKRAPVVVLPTGGGKTRLARTWVNDALRADAPIVWMAHRSELLTQARDTLLAGGLAAEHVAIVQGDRRVDPRAKVLVASLQTLATRARKALSLGTPLDQVLPRARLLVADESHHLPSDEWSVVAAFYGGAFRVGLTATPVRSDGRALGDIFDHLVVGATVRELITAGVLCRAEVIAPSRPQSELSMPIAAALERHAQKAPAVVFVPSVATAKALASELGSHAVWVAGEQPARERDAAIKAFESGAADVLVNAFLLCLDAQTEILTSTGWVGIDAMTPDRLVANWDDGRVTFEQPLEIIRRERAPGERMVSRKGWRTNVRVTEGHKMLYRTLAGGRFKKDQASALVGRRVELPISGHAHPLHVAPKQPEPLTEDRRALLVTKSAYNLRKAGVDPASARAEAGRRVDRRYAMARKAPSDLSLDECRFIGFWVGDGTVTRIKSGGLEYSASQSHRYASIISWFEGVVARLGLDVATREYPPAANKHPSPWPSRRWSFSRGTGSGCQERRGLFALEPYLNKHGSPLLWGLDEAQFSALLEGLWFADGLHGDAAEWRPNATIQITGADRGLFDLLQAIGVTRGYRVTINLGSNPRANGDFKQDFTLSLRKADGQRIASEPLVFEDEWVPERVWCVRVRTGNIVTRRGGKVVVMGNCEGWDSARLNASPRRALVIARGCSSWSTWRQIVGRGIRQGPGVRALCTVVDLRGAVHVHGLPDEEVEFSLEGDPVRRKTQALPAIAHCKHCWWIGSPQRDRCCPRCGARFPAPEPPKVKETAMARIDATASREDKQVYFNVLIERMAAKGYKPGWVGALFKARFGYWPNGFRYTGPRQLSLPTGGGCAP